MIPQNCQKSHKAFWKYASGPSRRLQDKPQRLKIYPRCSREDHRGGTMGTCDPEGDHGTDEHQWSIDHNEPSSIWNLVSGYPLPWGPMGNPCGQIYIMIWKTFEMQVDFSRARTSELILLVLLWIWNCQVSMNTCISRKLDCSHAHMWLRSAHAELRT